MHRYTRMTQISELSDAYTNCHINTDAIQMTQGHQAACRIMACIWALIQKFDNLSLGG